MDAMNDDGTATSGRRVFLLAGAFAGAQARRIGFVGIAAPLAAGALIALAGACWLHAAGKESATLAMMVLMQAYPLVVGVCAVSALTGDSLVEVQAALPVEFRAVQTLRAGMVLVGAAAGAFAMYAPLDAMGIVYRDIGWAGAVTPVGGAALMVLVAYAASALAGAAKGATLVAVAAWLFFALIWDPNVAPLVAQRGVPLLVMLAASACVWCALGAPEYAWRKMGGAR